MTERNLDGMPAEFDGSSDECEEAWATFTQRLSSLLAGMESNGDESDTLVIEIPTGTDPEGCAPYAQFATYGPGRLRVEMAGDWFLAPVYMCCDDDLMKDLGWAWQEMENWYLETTTADGVLAARIVVASLRGGFGIAHPQLMTYNAFGPGSLRAETLGLTATVNLTFEKSAETVEAIRPRDRNHLMELVGEELAAMFGEVAEADDDGDYAIGGPGQPMWVRVLPEAPAVQFMAVPTYDVHSRRATALELSILNRESGYARWALRDRTVWLTMTVPANPFVGEHLVDMYEQFVATLVARRADLALRCGGKTVQ